MIKVLCSQRDRFKDRANQLELQLAQVKLSHSVFVSPLLQFRDFCVVFSACSAANTSSAGNHRPVPNCSAGHMFSVWALPKDKLTCLQHIRACHLHICLQHICYLLYICISVACL